MGDSKLQHCLALKERERENSFSNLILAYNIPTIRFRGRKSEQSALEWDQPEPSTSTAMTYPIFLCSPVVTWIRWIVTISFYQQHQQRVEKSPGHHQLSIQAAHPTAHIKSISIEPVQFSLSLFHDKPLPPVQGCWSMFFVECTLHCDLFNFLPEE